MQFNSPRSGISNIRPPAVAGQFYPAEAGALRQAVEGYMDASGVAPAESRVAALVAPHAGYVYSGPTAGYAYARVRGGTCRRVILLGRSHGYSFSGWRVYAKGAFDTPLGAMPVDEAFARDLAEGGSREARQTHASEHALEVQLPFLQAALGEVTIVPILFGSDPENAHEELAARLASMTDENDLVVASTDLSHFLDEDAANALDHTSLDALLEQDPAEFAAGLREKRYSMCGGTAVFTAMHYAKARGAEDWSLLDYRSSAAVSGDRERVVGYGAVSMECAA